MSEVAALTGFVPRWLERLASRDNQFGRDALGDRRRRNGCGARAGLDDAAPLARGNRQIWRFAELRAAHRTTGNKP